jgi:hypothetical protein
MTQSFLISANRKFCIAVCLAAASLAATSSRATIYLNDNFDGYADQTAFQAAWAPASTSDLLSTEQAVSLNQSVKGTLTAGRNQKGVGEIGTLTGSSDKIIFKFNYYDSAGSASAYRQYAELDDTTAPSGSGQLFAMGLNNNVASTKYMARVLGFDGGTGSGAFFKLDAAGSPDRSTGWHSFEADIFDNNVKFYVDGVLSKDIDTTALTDRSLDNVRIGSNLSSTQVAYFDDIYVERTTVPEPSMVALGLVGGLLALRRKNKE